MEGMTSPAEVSGPCRGEGDVSGEEKHLNQERGDLATSVSGSQGLLALCVFEEPVEISVIHVALDLRRMLGCGLVCICSH